jgi:hypothetical protein
VIDADKFRTWNKAVKPNAHKYPDKEAVVRWAEILAENARLGRVIAASIRAKTTLGGAARDAIDDWQRAN